MTALSNLIETASRANKGRSMQAAADLATERGAPISKSHISKNARKIETVTPQLIRGIAAGYEIPPEEVARAVLADLGFAINDYSPSPESAIRRDPNLSTEARAMLLAALQAARTVASGASGARRPVSPVPQDEGQEFPTFDRERTGHNAAEPPSEDRQDHR